MEKMDASLERRVWQRVSRGPQPQREDLRPLVQAAREAAGDYRFLAAHLTGAAGDQAKRLYELAQDTAACLRGVQLLRGAAPGKQGPVPGGQSGLRPVLERSCRRARTMAGEYMARSADPECGPVFMALAQREQDAFGRLVSLLGQTGG
ncbi:MAG: hypothetical protein Q4F17_03850 [Eubacteriales bacterium]|nr:hypothetical protein [Eubacteriales bacterium]